MSEKDNYIFGTNSITLDGYSFSGFEPGDTINVNSSDSTDGIYTITDMNSTTFTIKDIYKDRLDELDEKFDKIMERLAILDEPDSDQLEKNRALKKAYDHYKFVEALAGAKKKDG